MPISTTARKTSPFVGNGSLTYLPFAFKVFAASDLEVVRTTTSTGAKSTLVLTTDYTVTLNADQDNAPGGYATLNSALATGYTVVVVSKIPNTQSVALTNAGGFFPRVLNGVFDRLAALIQQVAEKVSRTPQLPVDDSATWPSIPSAAGRANTVLGFGNDGTPALIPKADFVGPAGPAGADGEQGPQGPAGSGGVDGDGLPLTGGTMTGDITMKADGDGGISFARSSDDVVQGRIGRNNDALVVTALGAAVPLQLGANGIVRFTVQPTGAVRFEPLAAEPSSPSDGQAYYDSVADALRIYANGAWRTLAVNAGSSGAAGELSMSNVSVSNITTESATLSVLIGGTIPSGALMLIQWSSAPGTSWLGSPEPTTAVAGTYSYDAESLTAGTTYYVRASVYSEPGGGLPAVIHASTVLGSFSTAGATDDAPSYSQMVNEMDAPSEGRAMSWQSWANNPANVTFDGGSNSGKPCPAVIVAGALGRGTTMDLTPFGGLDPVDSAFTDSDPWTIYTPWLVVLEQGDLSTGAVRQHTEDNCAIQFERHIFTVYRNSLTAYQTIRDRTDLQTWYTATEDYLLANGAVETRSPTSEEGAGIIVRWNRASGNAVHGSLVSGAIGFDSTEFGNGIDMASIASDIRQVVLAARIRLVPWNRSAPFNPANCKLLVHVGCDLRARDPHQTLPSGPGWPIPPNVLSRQRLLSDSWDWYTACTLQDTIRSDRLDSANAEWGFTKATALATPIPGWNT